VGLFFTGFASIGVDYALVALVFGLIFGGGFLWASLKSKSPILDLSLFKGQRRFTLSTVAAFLSYISSFSIAPLLALYFQYSKGYSPTVTGFVLVFQPIFQALLTPIAGKLSDRHESSKLSSWGLFLILLGIILVAFFLDKDTPLILIIVCMSLCGAGFALFSAPNTNAVMSSVPFNRLGQSSGVVTVTRLTGQITSIALTTLVFSRVIGPGGITFEKYPLFVEATRILFFIFAPLCFLGIISALASGKNGRKPL
jgi:MFS family permease